tara:strand:+ start:566 stop:772 length:207 start_codon:yes stop_codon:yes gene_type:complete
MKPVNIRRVISVDECNTYNGISVWGNTIEISSGDTSLNIRCTDKQLQDLRDRLLDKFPVVEEEETEVE